MNIPSFFFLIAFFCLLFSPLMEMIWPFFLLLNHLHRSAHLPKTSRSPPDFPLEPSSVGSLVFPFLPPSSPPNDGLFSPWRLSKKIQALYAADSPSVSSLPRPPSHRALFGASPAPKSPQRPRPLFWSYRLSFLSAGTPHLSPPSLRRVCIPEKMISAPFFFLSNPRSCMCASKVSFRHP